MVRTIWKSTGKTNEVGSERGKSLWYEEKFRGEKSSIGKEELNKTKEISTQVLVIGGGMAGMLTAYMLTCAGKSVIVVDRYKVGGLITGNTTAKVTFQHGLIFDKLLTSQGLERTKEYAISNHKAIKEYENIIKRNKIDCDFEHRPNYVYTLDDKNKIIKELEACKRLRINASFEKEIELPFRIKGAIKFDKQAQFHPLKFIDGIAKKIDTIENINIKEIRSDGLLIADGINIKSESVVIASHYPFINRPGYYFLKMHQERFYVGALKDWNKEGSRLKGMYLDADPNGYSFRDYKDMLLLGTGSHRTGKKNPLQAYERIKSAKERWYTGASIEYMWSNQDCITPDSIPYIGRYSNDLPNFYVATGFNKWGMTNSMVSAMIIRDMICNKSNPYKKVYSPNRLMVSKGHKIIKDTAITTINFLSEKLEITPDKLKDIKKGRAGIIKYQGQKLGVYRDDNEILHYVTTKCPHLGCSLSWNPNELTWDCPCHGSRFDYHGKLISNPATRNVFDVKKTSK